MGNETFYRDGLSGQKKKLPELELRVSHSFDIKIVSRIWSLLKPTSGVIFLFKKSRYVMFFAILKLYL